MEEGGGAGGRLAVMDLFHFHLWRKAGLNSNHKFLELNWLELIVIEMIIKMSAIAVALLSGQASTPEWEGAVEPSKYELRDRR